MIKCEDIYKTCADNLKIFADIYGAGHDKIMENLEQIGLRDAARTPAANFKSKK